MDIPQISEAQLQIITDCVNNTNAFSQMQPDREKDSLEDFSNWTRGVEHTDGLVEMGLLEEITDTCKDQVARVAVMTGGRKFRIFEATKIAQEMFRPKPWIKQTEPPTIH